MRHKKMFWAETLQGIYLGMVGADDTESLISSIEQEYRDNSNTFFHATLEGDDVVKFFDDGTEQLVGWLSSVTGKFVRR